MSRVHRSNDMIVQDEELRQLFKSMVPFNELYVLCKTVNVYYPFALTWYNYSFKEFSGRYYCPSGVIIQLFAAKGITLKARAIQDKERKY